VRAVCGLAKPLVDAWQWQRAWALAFDATPHAVAWWWHRRRDALLPTCRPASCRARTRSRRCRRAGRHARRPARAWRRGEWRAEPRWNGVRVHVVRRGDDVAVWQRGGRLLNARLPPRGSPRPVAGRRA
jgi:ATP-dependent DNA ligase